MEREMVVKVAWLARVRLTDEEIDHLQVDMGRILDHVRELERAPESESATFWGGVRLADALRQDAACPSLPRERVLAEAPERLPELVKVPFPGEAT